MHAAIPDSPGHVDPRSRAREGCWGPDPMGKSWNVMLSLPKPRQIRFSSVASGNGSLVIAGLGKHVTPEATKGKQKKECVW